MDELSQWLCHDDSTVNIVVVIIIIIITVLDTLEFGCFLLSLLNFIGLL